MLLEISTPLKLLILGAGGHGKVVAATLLAAGHQVAAFVDDDERKQGQEIFHIRICAPGQIDWKARDCQGMTAIGDNSARCGMVAQYPDLEWIAAVHPHAFADSSASLGEGSIVMAGAVIQPDVQVGRHAIMNTGCRVDHDCKIGDYCHIAPGVTLAGDVRVGSFSLIGAGAVVLPGIKIGAHCIIGAGAVVVKDVPDYSVARGVPARVVRSVLHEH